MLGPEAEKLGWKNGEWLAALVRTKFSTSKKNDRPSVLKKTQMVDLLLSFLLFCI